MSGKTLNLPEEEPQDLGFGSKVSRRSQLRLLNQDGTFNVRREGISALESLSLYHALVTMAWPRFYLSILALYFALNTLIGFGYMLCGPGALKGAEGTTFMVDFRMRSSSASKPLPRLDTVISPPMAWVPTCW